MKRREKAPPGVHVVPARRETTHFSKLEWFVEEERGKGGYMFPTQRQAIAYARAVARKKGAELVIHGRDGKIRRKDSHGRDPRPPRGSRG